MKKYQVRVSYDKAFETLKEFQFETEEAANSFFDKAVERAKRIGVGTVAMFNRNVWLVKSFNI